MSFPSVLTLVAPALDDAIPRLVAARLPRAGAPVWLAPGRACDLPFAGLGEAQAQTVAGAALGGLPIDFLAQPAEGRKRRLLVADMDSTIITVECIDEIADYIGLKPEIAAITEQAMRGEIDFAAALRQRAAMLRGLPIALLARAYAERVRLSPGAAALVRTMRRDGAFTALVSGGFTYFTERVREAAGFDYDQANRLNLVGEALDGTVGEPILDADAKLAALRRLAAQRGIPLAATLAIGDGANDLPMLRAAGLGIAYRAKPIVAAAARARIRYTDLSTALYYQGYTAAEIAAAALSSDPA